MTRTKNQHYVPQCYLERFTNDLGRLHVFDKATGRSFCTGPRNVASEMSFYDLPAALKDVSHQAIERHFSKVEGQLAEVLRELTVLVEGNCRLHDEARDVLASHLALLYMRTKEFRTGIEQKSEFLRDLMIGLGQSAPEARTTALDHARFMFDNRTLPTITAVLRNHFWVVGRNDTAHPLYTSDSPVVRRPHAGTELVPETGLASPGIEIAFPFSPRYVLVLYERTHHAEIAGRDGGIFLMNDEAVRQHNTTQVILSYQRVFCSDDDFDLAQDIAAQFPKECDPDRARFEVNNPAQGGQTPSPAS